MIAHRLRGLLTLHVVVATACAALLFVAYAAVYNHIPRVQPLSSDAPFIGFSLCIVIGMVVGSRGLRSLSGHFHRITWVDAAQLASSQVVFVALVVFSFIFTFKEVGLSRLFLGSYLLLCWALLLLLNKGLPHLLSHFLFSEARRLRTLFVGPAGNLHGLKGWLASKQVLGLQPVGLLTTDGTPSAETNPPFLGELAEMEQVLVERNVAQVVLLEIPRTQIEGNRLIDLCEQRGCRLLIYSNTANFFRHPLVTVNEEGHQFYALQVEPLEDPLNRILKRLLDIALSLPVVLFVLPPLSLWVWLMQRLQAPGPLLFIQERTGHGQKPFRMLKYRSMYYTGRNPGVEAEQARAGDKRIYPFGSFLRRTSLDEFPQFLNVLLGSMSLVGPRPHLPLHDQKFAGMMMSYRTRFFVKPGITGLAQCSGYRGEITDPILLQKRVECDVIYITQWSIWLDCQLVLKTAAQVVFPPKSAY